MKGAIAFVVLVACIGLASAATLAERRLANIRAVYDHLVYPGPVELIKSNSTAATFFHPNVTGRITPAGMFPTRQDTVEYFYALGNPVTYNIQEKETRVIQNDIRVLDLVGNRASIFVNIHFAPYPSNTTDHNLTQTGWFGFKPDDDKVAYYDLTILRLGWASDIPAVYHGPAIQVLCNSIMSACTGPYQQYESFQNCTDFMATLDYGSWNNAMSNTVVCRTLHNLLTRVRPEYHCAHVGPTGGMKCYDRPYDTWYNSEFVLDLAPDTKTEDTCGSSASTLGFSFAALAVVLLALF